VVPKSIGFELNTKAGRAQAGRAGNQKPERGNCRSRNLTAKKAKKAKKQAHSAALSSRFRVLRGVLQSAPERKFKSAELPQKGRKRKVCGLLDFGAK
jgi:hypothetical protein